MLILQLQCCFDVVKGTSIQFVFSTSYQCLINVWGNVESTLNRHHFANGGEYEYLLRDHCEAICCMEIALLAVAVII